MNANGPVDSCKSAQWGASSAAVWVGVVELAAAWLAGVEPTGAALEWVAAAREALEGGELGAARAAAERVERSIGWTLATGVRAGTAALYLDAREAGRYPATAAIPFALARYVHPLSLAAALLEDAAERSGRSQAEAWSHWCRVALGAKVLP